MKKSIFVISGVVVFVLAGVVAIMVGLTNSVGNLAVEMNQNQVDAMLASASVENETLVSVPILYYKQVKDECVNLYDKSDLVATRQFEWSDCGYFHRALEKELTEPVLNDEYLPVGKGGDLLSNRGMAGDGFLRWFNTVEGKSQVQADTLNLKYTSEVAGFSFKDENFYPVGPGQLFTLNLGVPVEARLDGKESFAIAADDDTWVYLDNKIVLDMGGIHGAMNGRFEIRENGEVYAAVGDEDLAYSGVKLEKGAMVVRVFHANRDSAESVFEVNFENMLLNVTDTVLAFNDGESEAGATVAYNPDDPTYVPPLGESITTNPNKSRMILTSVTTQAAAMGALIVVVTAGIFAVWRQVRKK